MKTPITIDLVGVPLRRSLKLIAEQLGMGVGIRDGMVTMRPPDMRLRNWHELLVLDESFPQSSPLDVEVERARRGELTTSELDQLNERLKAIDEATKLYRSIRMRWDGDAWRDAGKAPACRQPGSAARPVAGAWRRAQHGASAAGMTAKFAGKRGRISGRTPGIAGREPDRPETRRTMNPTTPATSKPRFQLPQSHEAFVRASRVIPGGVNSPARAFGAVGGEPPFMARAEGAYLFDIDGHQYIDYIGSWGPMILGHGHPQVKTAVAECARAGHELRRTDGPRDRDRRGRWRRPCPRSRWSGSCRREPRPRCRPCGWRAGSRAETRSSR